MSKRIFVCSPLRGNVRRNIARVHVLCKLICKNTEHAPFAPHGFYTLFLDDTDALERERGMAAGARWLEACDELWVYVPPEFDGVTAGMATEIAEARRLHKDVRVHTNSGLLDRVWGDHAEVEAATADLVRKIGEHDRTTNS